VQYIITCEGTDCVEFTVHNQLIYSIQNMIKGN